jgi:hypothetical protein
MRKSVLLTIIICCFSACTLTEKSSSIDSEEIKKSNKGVVETKDLASENMKNHERDIKNVSEVVSSFFNSLVLGDITKTFSFFKKSPKLSDKFWEGERKRFSRASKLKKNRYKLIEVFVSGDIAIGAYHEKGLPGSLIDIDPIYLFRLNKKWYIAPKITKPKYIKLYHKKSEKDIEKVKQWYDKKQELWIEEIWKGSVVK